MKNEFQQHLRCLYNVYKMVLPQNVSIVCFHNKHLEVHLDYPPVVIHNCIGCQAIYTNRIKLIIGETTTEKSQRRVIALHHTPKLPESMTAGGAS